MAQIFPQPRLANGQLMDSVLGLNFAVIGDEALLAGVSASTRARWQALGVVMLPARDPELRAWLVQHGAGAVLLRPDRYIMGMAQTALELDRLSTLLPATVPASEPASETASEPARLAGLAH